MQSIPVNKLVVGTKRFMSNQSVRSTDDCRLSVTVIIVGNLIGAEISNPGWGCLHFTLC